MKLQTIQIGVYEKGDRVITPEGVATVMEDEVFEVGAGDVIRRLDLAYSEVEVELDESCSSWSGRKGTMETSGFILEDS